MKEIKLISFLQTFAIILVVLGHSGYEVPYLLVWIGGFHMPLFVFISGYLFFNTLENINKIDIKSFILKKVNRLLLPYFFISTIAYFPKYFLNNLAWRKVEFSLHGYIKGLLYPWDNPIIFFWFLPTIFFILIFTFILAKLFNKFKISLHFGVLALVFVFICLTNDTNIKLFNISGILNYYVFFVFGVCYSKNEVLINKTQRLNSGYVLCCLFALTFLTLLNPYERDTFSYGGNIFYLMFAIIGILFSISLGMMYSRKEFSFFNHLFGAAYTIFLLSWFPQIVVRIFMIQLFKVQWPIGLFVSTILGIYIPLIIYKLAKQINQKNWSIGNKMIKVMGI
jgi:fucose 4-O-acetylase-like acetyltransferase